MVSPINGKANVDNIKGAPSIAPIPISLPLLSWKNSIAITGNIDSGKAVPTAASILPVKFFDRSKASPTNSTLLVNNSAAKSITKSPTDKSRKSKNIS